jgi:hypothetical protein
MVTAWANTGSRRRGTYVPRRGHARREEWRCQSARIGLERNQVADVLERVAEDEMRALDGPKQI